ncbi:MAG: DUF4091 domain-containing protein [Kiritimatiellae bacterium]|nr:DUF4091 domain-containing protein [Kiritimatiellia bacterium]
MSRTRNRSGTSIWAQGPMRRIFADDPVPHGPARRIELFAARGETECFQIGVRTDPDRTEWSKYIVAKASDLRGPGGISLPASGVDLLYPELVPVKWAILPPQAPGDTERPAPAFFPDPLVEDWRALASFPNPMTRSIWVRIRVPRNARPGVYRGTVTVSASEFAFPEKEADRDRKLAAGCVGSVAVSLRVWDFEIPRVASLLTTNWFFPGLAARWFKTPMWSPAFWKLMARFADDMAAHRQNCVLTTFFDPDAFADQMASVRGQDHQSPPTTDQMVGVRQEGRRYTFDFRRLDRWANLFFRRGFRLLEGGHVAFKSRDGARFWLTDRHGVSRKMAWSAQDPKYEDFLRQFMGALWQHLGRRGWRERYLQHISDEPGPDQFERYRHLTELVRAVAPGIKLMDAMAHPEYAKLIDCPVPLESVYEDVVAKSGRAPGDVWTYYCCGPQGRWPNRFIQYPLVRLRIIPWLCFKHGIPGLLHWGYNYWTGIEKDVYNPWDDTTIHRYPPGDACVVYPPRDTYMGDALSGSIRWEIIRKSLEDHEYLRLTKMLADSGNLQAARIIGDMVRTAVPGWTTHTRDPKRLDLLRRRMGQLLHRHGSVARKGSNP